MAMPPTPAAAPMAPADDMPPAAGAAAPGADMGEADEGAEPPVLFTVMGPPEGPYQLVAGDEPEGEGAMAADAPSFATPQELMKAIMALLNPDKGAEDAFAGGFSGKSDDTAGGGPPMPG